MRLVAGLALAAFVVAGCRGPAGEQAAARRRDPTAAAPGFPALPEPDGEQVALGRLLFFDRVLSGARDASCADCHRPEFGLSDGRRTSPGIHGPLVRNTPTLYNVAFKPRLFWDRRAASLEEQVRGPLFSPDEMGSTPGELVARLRALPPYVERFERAFPGGGEPVSVDRVARALAAFERTLLSTRSRYDRWTAGDRSALTPAEQRGLATFRSPAAGCIGCHPPPTFDAPIAAGIGVPGDDPGVGGVTGDPVQLGRFGVPTLRNVARTAPYMHDGSIATLDDVVAFYRAGAGRGLGVAAGRIDPRVRALDLGDDEASDLVAFLGALTDESRRPRAPESVPSGLPVARPRLERMGEEPRSR